MEKEILSKMKKYLSIHHIVNIVVIVGSLITILMLLILKPMLGTAPSIELNSIIGITILIVFLSFIIGVVKSFMLNRQIKGFKKSGELIRILNDFQFAQPMYNGRIMLGKEYIFGKNYTKIVPYRDIARLYLCIHNTNGVNTQRTLKAKLTNSKHVSICYLTVYKNTKEEEQAVIDAILKRNPDIQVGYQP